MNAVAVGEREVVGVTTSVRVSVRRLSATVLGIALAAAGTVHLAGGAAASTPPSPGSLADVRSASGSSPATVPVPATAAPATYDARLSAQRTVRAAPPVAVAVDRLGIAAPVAAVGVDAGGGVAVPPDDGTAGWYRYGSAPGDPAGTTVLVGHVDHRGRPGVFFRLASAAPGDVVTVTDAEGVVHGYRITLVARLPKMQIAASGVFRTDGPGALVLVTCGGAFDPDRRSYADNVVVVAEPDPTTRRASNPSS